MGYSSIYSNAEIYDLAFSYRDFEAEVNFLIGAYSQATGGKAGPRSVLEIASGSGRHIQEFIKRGIAVAGLVDIARPMIASAEELLGSSGAAIELLNADLRSFVTNRHYDLAICMIDSLSHLIEEDDLVLHLQTVRNALSANGVYIVELARPMKEGDAGHTTDQWSVENDRIFLNVKWGRDAQILDAKRRIARIPVQFEVRPKVGGREFLISDAYIGREWTFEAFKDAIACISGLRLAHAYADFDLSCDYLPDGMRGWRMILAIVREET